MRFIELNVKFAMKELKSILKACNKIGIKDANELIKIPMMIKVTKRTYEGEYRTINIISNYTNTGKNKMSFLDKALVLIFSFTIGVYLYDNIPFWIQQRKNKLFNTYRN